MASRCVTRYVSDIAARHHHEVRTGVGDLAVDTFHQRHTLVCVPLGHQLQQVRSLRRRQHQPLEHAAQLREQKVLGQSLPRTTRSVSTLQGLRIATVHIMIRIDDGRRTWSLTIARAESIFPGNTPIATCK
eukprot:774305-Rhodomonas_salina.2